MPPEDRAEVKPRRFVAAAAALGIGSAVASTLGVLNSDAFITRGFDEALASFRSHERSSHALAFNGVVGSEDDWLRTTGTNAIVKAVSIGEKIELTANGAERNLVITDVRDLGDAATHIDTSPTSSRVLLITCREGDGALAREIRFRLEGGRVKEIAADPLARAL